MKLNLFLLIALSITALASHSQAADDSVSIRPNDIVHRALDYLIVHKKDIDVNKLKFVSISYTFKPKEPFLLSGKDQRFKEGSDLDDSLVVIFRRSDSEKEVKSVGGKGTVIQAEGITVRLPTPHHPDWDIGLIVFQGPKKEKAAEQATSTKP